MAVDVGRGVVPGAGVAERPDRLDRDGDRDGHGIRQGRDAAPGAGLGLTITRYLCRQLGYGLELGESAQGSGCRCVLTLPLDPEPEPADAPLWQPPVKA